MFCWERGLVQGGASPLCVVGYSSLLRFLAVINALSVAFASRPSPLLFSFLPPAHYVRGLTWLDAPPFFCCASCSCLARVYPITSTALGGLCSAAIAAVAPQQRIRTLELALLLHDLLLGNVGCWGFCYWGFCYRSAVCFQSLGLGKMTSDSYEYFGETCLL